MSAKKFERLLVDLGSSTAKIYGQAGGSAELLSSASIPFKEAFNEATGVTQANYLRLVGVINSAKQRHAGLPMAAYATALFRKMSEQTFREFAERLQEDTGVTATPVPHEDEARYLELALAGRYDQPDPVLLINVGGGSTELVVLEQQENVESHQLDLGVGTLLKEFPELNEPHSGISLERVKQFVEPKVPTLKHSVGAALFSGGELTYMRVAGYPLERNELFTDPDHPQQISAGPLANRNREIFEAVTLSELEAMMPDNPTWMHGARAYSAATQAIVEKYGVETVIPSDANMINGLVRAKVAA